MKKQRVKRTWAARDAGGPGVVTEGFRAFVLDQLGGVRDLTVRSMFGGVGLYSGELFFGIIMGDVLYLKADETTRAEFEAAGGHAFKPYAHRPATMQYWSVPASALENVNELGVWSRKAIAAAGRAAAAKSVRRGGRHRAR